MQNIFEVLQEMQAKDEIILAKSRVLSERAELVGQFTDRINEQRGLEGREEFRPPYIAMRLAHIPTEDLYFFLKKCQSGNFNKIFFGSLKTR